MFEIIETKINGNGKYIETDRYGNKFYRNKNRLYHRDNGPAIEGIEGSNAWYVNGQRHRLDGPAMELVWCIKKWYFNDKCHRLDGPAIESYSGNKKWFINNYNISSVNNFIELFKNE